jgi:hypothetical protein
MQVEAELRTKPTTTSLNPGKRRRGKRTTPQLVPREQVPNRMSRIRTSKNRRRGHPAKETLQSTMDNTSSSSICTAAILADVRMVDEGKWERKK